MVDRAVFVLALVQVWSVKHTSHNQAKISTKGVDGHRTAGILSLKRESLIHSSFTVITYHLKQHGTSESFPMYSDFW